MKVRLFTLFLLLALVFAAVPQHKASAQAYATSFTTSITYQNVGNATANVSVLFYSDPSDTTPEEIPQNDLAAGASTSLFIGGLNQLGTEFQGSAIMMSDQPLLATLVQLPQAPTNVKVRPLSNGFSAGSSTVLLATVLKNSFSTTSIFSIQNVGASATTATIAFYNTSAAKVHEFSQAIQPGAAYYVDAGKLAQLGASFNGSAVITSAGGSLVASVMELSTTGTAASAFEGVPSGSTTFYMPSALCNPNGANTAYAVQNTSLTTQTNVTVTYSNGATQTQQIGPGAKKSFGAAMQPACLRPGSAALQPLPAPPPR
jgi:hypothetical protein